MSERRIPDFDTQALYNGAGPSEYRSNASHPAFSAYHDYTGRQGPDRYYGPQAGFGHRSIHLDIPYNHPINYYGQYSHMYPSRPDTSAPHLAYNSTRHVPYHTFNSSYAPPYPQYPDFTGYGYHRTASNPYCRSKNFIDKIKVRLLNRQSSCP